MRGPETEVEVSRKVSDFLLNVRDALILQCHCEYKSTTMRMCEGNYQCVKEV